jgi:hypothetical protein
LTQITSATLKQSLPSPHDCTTTISHDNLIGFADDIISFIFEASNHRLGIILGSNIRPIYKMDDIA